MRNVASGVTTGIAELADDAAAAAASPTALFKGEETLKQRKLDLKANGVCLLNDFKFVADRRDDLLASPAIDDALPRSIAFATEVSDDQLITSRQLTY